MENEKRNFNILPSGKKIAIHKVANSALYRVAFTSGGELPPELSGMWTDAYQAQKAITAYITKKEREIDSLEESLAKVEKAEQEIESQEPVVTQEEPEVVEQSTVQESVPEKKVTKKKTVKKKSVAQK